MVTPDGPQRHASTVRVMISYSRDNSDFAKRLWGDLNGHGFATWMDQRDIPGGARWDDEIRAGIDGAQVVLVVLSPTALASKWVRKEYNYALQQRKVVIPLKHFPCDIPARLAPLQAIDFRPNFVNAEAYYAQQFGILTESISGYEAKEEAVLVPTRKVGSRFVTVALGTTAIIGATLAVILGYKGGVLVPKSVQPYFEPWAPFYFVAAFGLLLVSMVGLILQLRQYDAGMVHLYLGDRRRFLSKIATRYSNRLKPPFEGALLLTLGLNEDDQALAHPLLAAQNSRDTQPHPLPVGKRIAEVFQEGEGQLLILGAPGAGKSTLVYQLAQNLASRAQTDDSISIPVVFNLASWAQDRKRLEDWMVDQLVETWSVPLPIAQAWVNQREMLPLLDGLDEVSADAREACIQTINRYHRTHGLDPLVVCSRTADYYAQDARLDLQKAVVAQPLTAGQIDAYLASGGQQLETLRDLARVDGEIRALLATPLLLNVVSLAYANKAANTIPRTSTERISWTQAVFHDYVQEMLARRFTLTRPQRKTGQASYSDSETTRYLAWLAAQMKRYGRTDIFYLEQVQPNWLPDNRARRKWRRRIRTVWGLIFGLIGALGGGVLTGFLDGSTAGFWGVAAYGTLFGLVFGLIYTHVGMLSWRVWSSTISLTMTVRWFRPTWRGVRHSLGIGVQTGFGIGTLLVMGGALVAGLASDSGGVLAAEVIFWLFTGILGSLFLGAVFALVVGPFGGLVGALGTLEEVDARDLSIPDEGAIHSLRSGLAVTLVVTSAVTLFIGLAFGVGLGLFGRLGVAMLFGLYGGLAFGLAFGLDSGSGAYLQHQLLLRALVRLRLIPPNFIAFLDFAADHVLLQRVGGGYRFIHALLLDYFAAQWPDLSTLPRKEGV